MTSTSPTCSNGHNPSSRRRFTVARRLMVILAATASLSTALAVVLHGRTLTADLERAAEQRLDRANEAAHRLVDAHLQAMSERYRAISATPELRASLEIDHAPTLAYYARTLRDRERADLVAFLDREDRVIAADGDGTLLDRVLSLDDASLIAHGGQPVAVVSSTLRTSAGRIGRLVAAEPVSPRTLEEWSVLCGAEVSLASPDGASEDRLVRTVRSLGAESLVVAADLEAEHAAMRRSRANLIAAGSIAVALSLLACAFLARGFVRPIVAIQHAADHIRRGDLHVRLRSRRSDEIGDVARAFDRMLDELGESRREIESSLAELQRSREHLDRAQEMARLGSFELDFEKERLTDIRGSEQLRNLYALAPGAPIDAGALFERVHPEDREALMEAVREVVEQGRPLRSEFRAVLPDGEERVMYAQARRIPLGEGRTTVSGTVQDVTESRRADEQIRYLSRHDLLTGLGNRRLLEEGLELAIARARRHRDRLGVLLVNLDHFKRINATLSHRGGDEALRHAADRLTRTLRESDLVSRGDSDSAISRLAGDEFTVLLSDLRDVQDLALVATRILHALGRPLEIEGHEIVLQASIGIAAWPSDGEDADTLMRSATSAAQHAKQRGGNHYQFYDESMNAAASEYLQLEARIRHALERDEFEMHYQPKVSLRDGRVVGFESLLRWRDPSRGIVGPQSFIPVAEQCGLISPLGRFALEASCRQIASWQSDGHRLPVSVNLSVHQFKSGTLVEDVEAVIEETGIDPSLLELEVTESAVMHDEKGVVGDLERLRARGLSISLDDFGTGQSSLAYLRRLPVQTLKIDMSFVRTIAENDADARLTAAIVALGHARELRVIAEGVESDAQCRLLADWGCDEIQGFLVSPAVPADEAIRLAADPHPVPRRPGAGRSQDARGAASGPSEPGR